MDSIESEDGQAQMSDEQSDLQISSQCSQDELSQTENDKNMKTCKACEE